MYSKDAVEWEEAGMTEVSHQTMQPSFGHASGASICHCVEEIFPLEPVLRLVASSVENCRQFSERVFWQKLPGAAGLLEHRPGGDHRGRDQEDREQHPEQQTMNRGELNFIWLSET